MWLCEEEQLILRYVEQMQKSGTSAREICRRAADKDRWKENERWAMPFIQGLRDKGLLDTNKAGLFIPTEKSEG